MSVFVLSVLLVVGGFSLLAVRLPSSQHTTPGRRLPRVVTVVMVALGVVLLASSCVTTVGTKDVGVVTTFGRPTGRDLENGLHLKAPWQRVTEMDGAIQPDEYTGGSCIPVRIGDSSTACASITIRWRIVPLEASVLYQNYRSNNVNETIKRSLVETQLKAALNEVLGAFNPLANVNVAANSSSDNTQISAAPDLDKFSTDIVASMNRRLAAINDGKPQIDIKSVTLSFLELSETTQAKINGYQAEVGNTRIAEQQGKTAAAQAAANRALAASVSKDPNVLVSKCLDTLEEMVKNKMPPPAGFSCWPAGGSALVLPATK
jgi:regulator of protease activity HflC (stomatin/prohibitin superfamily)